MKKNLLKTLVVSCVTALMFMGCGAKTEDGANNVSENTITVTDVRGEVEIPADPKIDKISLFPLKMMLKL